MKCLRCGYCCTKCLVTIVVDPDLPNPFVRENLKAMNLSWERCPHLIGNTPGEYSCAIHDRPWFKDTPCGQFSQVEQNEQEECRIGKGVMSAKHITIEFSIKGDEDKGV